MNITRYARPNAAIRGMISRLLTPRQRRELIVAPGLEEALRQLEATAYSTGLAALPGDGANLASLEAALKRDLVSAYCAVIHALDGRPRALMDELLRRLEVDDLKAILRGRAAGAASEGIRPLLVPLAACSRLPVDALLAASGVAEAIEALGALPYARPLRDALERYRREGTLFPLEVALDLDYYRRLWATVQALPARDRAVARRAIGVRYDVITIDWLLRYKALYRLSPEETFNYTLPFGLRIDDQVIRRAAAAPDLPGLVAELPEPYRGLLLPLAGREGLWRLEVALQRYLWRKARLALAGYPLQIGVPLAYLHLKEAEVHDLRAILEGKRYGRSPEEIRAFLWGEA